MVKENVSSVLIIGSIIIVSVVIFGIYIGINNNSKPIEINKTAEDKKITITDENLQSVKDSTLQKKEDIKTVQNLPKDTTHKNMTGQEFLAYNKTQPGVTTTASGLQYKVINMGAGAKPKATDTVKVDYEGKLINGTVFDSSYKRGESIEFPLSGVIAGWTEGLQYMPVGSKFEFVIPSNLAYRERGAGGLIGPNETLIFEVELHGIK